MVCCESVEQYNFFVLHPARSRNIADDHHVCKHAHGVFLVEHGGIAFDLLHGGGDFRDISGMAGGTTEPHYGTACGVIRSKEHFLTRNRKKNQKKIYFFLPEKYHFQLEKKANNGILTPL